ncbi:hypothetical protein L248_0648 [Schleiferilactobacillus shenzhenensis LY-73]|uniref:Uncharacterized protein n=2 Tax=Schleiferilactobacillus shenzhenensis TaxID=1231337 RepID=U4TKJ2_9LACO|nr:hypothetical protein L248_0648 [Schleiferilactobacillus shenzhenensis LY-73]
MLLSEVQQLAEALLEYTSIMEQLQDTVRDGWYAISLSLDPEVPVVAEAARNRETVVAYLDATYPTMVFQITPHLFHTDFTVTDVAAKQAYDALPKTHILGDVFQKIDEDYGVGMDLPYDMDLNKWLTEAEYQKELAFWKEILLKARHKEHHD